jgi:hypothetical protein
MNPHGDADYIMAREHRCQLSRESIALFAVPTGELACSISAIDRVKNVDGMFGGVPVMGERPPIVLLRRVHSHGHYGGTAVNSRIVHERVNWLDHPRFFARN